MASKEKTVPSLAAVGLRASQDIAPGSRTQQIISNKKIKPVRAFAGLSDLGGGQAPGGGSGLFSSAANGGGFEAPQIGS